jgi:HD-like signal output (HDOD) protein
LLLVLIAAVAAAALLFRRRGRAEAPRASSASAHAPATAQAPAGTQRGAGATGLVPGAAADDAGLREALVAATHRLWSQSFAAGGMLRPLDDPQLRILEDVRAAIASGTISNQHLPRRPALMPQLQAAVHDTEAGPRLLADIIAKDPVLTGDVLRLANSVRFRRSTKPVENIQSAIITCGTDGLQSLLASALMHPVFRLAQGSSQFPVLLCERSTRAAEAAEALPQRIVGADRFTVQLLTLLAALGPLVVYRMIVERYQQARTLVPEPELFVHLIEAHGRGLSQQIARQWESSPRLVAALGVNAQDELARLLDRVELLSTVSLLRRAGFAEASAAPLAPEVAEPVLERLNHVDPHPEET